MNPFDPSSDATHLELASALLDGAASPDQVAHVAGSAELQSLVTEMRAVRGLLAAIPEVQTSRVDASIGVALAAWDSARAEQSVSSVEGTVHPFTARRRRQLGWFSGAAAAAVLVVVAVGVRGGSDSPPEGAASKTAAAVTTSLAGANTRSVSGGTDGEPSSQAAPSGGQAPAVAGSASGAESAASDPAPVAAPSGPVLSTPAGLLGLALPTASLPTRPAAPGTIPVGAGTPGAATAGATSGTAVDQTTFATAGSACITPGTIDLGPVVYQGRAALAVEDPVAHERRALALDDCSVLAAVAVP
jgi:hypothetical protein